MDRHQQDGDTFLGYLLARVEETLVTLVRKVNRLDQKIDALGTDMTPADRAALIATLNAESLEVTQVAAQLKAVAATMDVTAKE